MLNIGDSAPVYLYRAPTDMRCGFDRLAELARSQTGKSPLQGGFFVFLCRGRKRVKILYWHEDGYCLWYKRLEAGTFRVETRDGYEELIGVDLKLLLGGMDFRRIKLRKEVIRGVYS